MLSRNGRGRAEEEGLSLYSTVFGTKVTIAYRLSVNYLYLVFFRKSLN
jgi:hypothetical protein